ncbi:MAG TPA: phosphoribosylformylglycinamidine synthase subunit PurQ, partial [Candidatus Berkiella sp.]|nr:phosphoribosylformylglycinamidine synthase subunit PurQ [Candidatus Berkiella sp.]
YEAVQAVGKELCPAWNITVPVGKDSLSMRSVWQDEKGQYEVVSPVTLVVSAFAPVNDIRKTVTPLLTSDIDSVLVLVDLASGKQRLGGSIYAQITNQIAGLAPDVDEIIMPTFVNVLNQLKAQELVLAYHDRSDGGLLITLCEMAFASHVGLTIDLSTYIDDWSQHINALFNEELGVVIQLPQVALQTCQDLFKAAGLENVLHVIATINDAQSISLVYEGHVKWQQERKQLHALWSKTSAVLEEMRDNPATAKQNYERIVKDNDPGFFVKLPEALPQVVHFHQAKPKVAILREQGVNGHQEMAAAFTLAGFEAIDVTMTDLFAGLSLKDFHGIAACGGFSYGDVLGAGVGWAKSILYSPALKEEFSRFFSRSDTFTLGVCNGCQMLSQLKELIPGTAHWPQMKRNRSQQFEARLSLVEICQSPSILLEGLAGMI